MRTEGRRHRHDKLSQLDTLGHTATVGSDDAGHCKAAYEQCHELLTDRCDLIAENGGVARELSPNDWANLSKLAVSHPFDSSKLAK